MPEDKQINKVNLSVPEESKKLLWSILMELNKSVKAYHIYPENHPSLKTLLEKSFQNVNNLLEGIEESQGVVISIERNSFYDIKGEAINKEKISDLANEFFHRRINRLTILKEILRKDWTGLVRLINTDPKEIMDMGGAEKFFVEQGITGITINEIKYEDIVDMVTELDKETEKDAIEDKEGFEEKEKEGIPLSQDITAAFAFEDEEPVQKKSELDQIIELLEKERDNDRYRDIVKRLVRKAVALKDAKEIDNFVRILYIFAKHSASDSMRPKEQQDTSCMAVKNLFDPYTANILVELMCIEGGNRISEIKTIISRIGEDMITYLVDALIERKDIRARRNLYNLILEFGESAVQHIEAKLEDGRWFVVRQMVSLLGAIRSPDSIEALKKSLNYPDIKVNKEAVKAMAMLGTKESIQELINTLYSSRQPLSIQAIISLGAIKVSAAVPTLIDFIEKMDIWGRDHVVKKEAINALGNIGDSRAVPVLSHIVKKRRKLWRRTAHRELRNLAALSLGRIGGEEAADILQEALKRSKGLIYQSCIKALKGLKATGANV